jgi:hypothetical protein
MLDTKWEANGIGSESCKIMGFGINGIEPLGSTIRQLSSYDNPIQEDFCIKFIWYFVPRNFASG